ncbi:MAG: hypothetical protein K6G24_13710 [Lachnospiraceae bacterium]|nr:hypothetical protein [Lachnospiraceae bacterium]
MPAPTINDGNVFSGVSASDRFKVLKGYLWLDHNMSEVGRTVFPYEETRSSGEKVSAIMRCYGFGGENHGVFRKWGIANTVTDRDLQEFIKRYPNGCTYDERGSEMYRFLKQLIDKRIEAERVQKQHAQEAERVQRQRAAEEERRRQAAEAEQRRRAAEEEHRYQMQLAEERKRRLEIEAEQRRIEEERRRAQEEEERRAREAAQKEEQRKKRAMAMAAEAERQIRTTTSYDGLISAVELYKEAMSLGNTQTKSVIIETEKCIKISPAFMDGCIALMKHFLEKKDYNNVLKYGNYVCKIPEREIKWHKNGRQKDFHEIRWECHLFVDGIDRTNGYYPEMECVCNMVEAKEAMRYIDDAIHIAQYGVLMSSVWCIRWLGDYFARFNSRDSILKSYQYFNLISSPNNEEIIKKKKTSEERVFQMYSDEIDQTLSKYLKDWLPAPLNPSDTWESYSGLSDTESEAFARVIFKQKFIFMGGVFHLDDLNFYRYYDGRLDVNFAIFKKYVAGQINLNVLWRVYVDAHSEINKKWLFFKKKHYTGEIMAGDFIDCCKFLWEKKYKSGMAVEISPLIDIFNATEW